MTGEINDQRCLNCGDLVAGKFCKNCGQEYHQHKYNFWGMLRHFVYDLFHFDGKFFHTLKLLFLKPGLPASDYVNGKKVRHFDPVKMYLFISAFTFFLFPFVLNTEAVIDDMHILATPSERLTEASKQYELIKQAPNREAGKNLDVLLNRNTHLLLRPGSDTTGSAINIEVNNSRYKAIPVTDSILFPERNWLEQKISRNMKEKYESEGENLNRIIELQTKVQFKILPYLFFLSLPLFAFILQWVYNGRQNYHFSDHSIFTLYHYVVVFIVLLIILLLAPLFRILNIDPLFLLYSPSVLLVSFYLLVEMKRFYKEGWGSTFLKFLLVSLGSFIGFVLLYLLFIMGSLLM